MKRLLLAVFLLTGCSSPANPPPVKAEDSPGVTYSSTIATEPDESNYYLMVGGETVWVVELVSGAENVSIVKRLGYGLETIVLDDEFGFYKLTKEQATRMAALPILRNRGEK